MPEGLGLGTTLQALPFQCSMRVLLKSLPTAQALVADVAATPSRASVPEGLGLGTTSQALPFQCSIRVLLVWGDPLTPTAQALLGDVAAAALRTLSLVPRFGLGTTAHVLPFH